MRIRNFSAEAHPGAAEVQNGSVEARLGAEEAHCETVEAPPWSSGESEGQCRRMASFGLDPDPRQNTKSLIRISIKASSRIRIRVKVKRRIRDPRKSRKAE